MRFEEHFDVLTIKFEKTDSKRLRDMVRKGWHFVKALAYLNQEVEE